MSNSDFIKNREHGQVHRYGKQGYGPLFKFEKMRCKLNYSSLQVCDNDLFYRECLTIFTR